VPSTQLAGDMFGYHWLDKKHLAIYLLDVSGHGVGSALLAVSAGNVLSTGTAGANPRDPAAVVTRLNEMFQMDRQDGKYFTIWYGVYTPASRTLAYCNAGHPPALLFSEGTFHQLEADAPAVGMMPDMPYEARTVEVAVGARLIVFSDGIFEIEAADGSMWPFSEFLARMKAELAADGDLIERHLRYTRELMGRDAFSDDFSMVDVRF
jgi:sigma-B regulation protein RsbU (phosphoserine phosphatase)